LYDSGMTPLRIGFIGFDKLNALDLVGPAEAFTTALVDQTNGKSRRGYEVLVIGLTSRTFFAESGIAFHPHTTIQAAPKLDTLIIPGGEGLRRPHVNQAIARWVKRKAAHTRRIVSVCTGIYGLAPTGLLDGRRVTTHWRFAGDVAARF
jgi:transcriptional regulator GlxA family with amidase domain